MDFSTAIRTCLQKYAGFQGRAPRSEYWYYVLFQFLAMIAALVVDMVLGSPMVLYTLVILGLFLPSLAVGVRRLHDINRSGWWLLLGFVPIVGAIVLIIWVCTRGTSGPNDYGADPLGG